MSESMRASLPKGWVFRSVGEIVSVDAKQVYPSDRDFTSLPFLGLENIESGTRQFVLPDEVTETVRSACWRFSEKHVLYGKLRPYLNKVFLPEKDGRCSLEILPLLPINDFSRDFVGAVLQSPFVVKFASQHSTGGRMPRADIRKLFAFKVPTPKSVQVCNSFGSQLSGRLERCLVMRRGAERQLEAVSALPAAILRDFFSSFSAMYG